MGLFSRNKFKKLTRADVVDSIIQLEKEEENLEEGIIQKTIQKDALMEKGKKETNRDLKLFYAKKINYLVEEKQQDIKRAMYLLYNIRLLKQLKEAIDNNNFFAQSQKVSLGNLLSDQAGLAKFLNRALRTKIRAEDVLTNADQTFMEIQSSYEENESIYGVNESDDSLLAMFETEEGLDMEDSISDIGNADLALKKDTESI